MNQKIEEIKMRIRNITVIAGIYLRYARRNPGFYFLQVVFLPMSILIPLLILTQGLIVDLAVGSLICTQVVMTIQDVGDIVSGDKARKSRSFFITTPIKPTDYMIGIALAPLGYNVIGGAILLAFCRFALGVSIEPTQLFGIVLVLGAAWFISALVGFGIAEYGPRNWYHTGAICGIVSFFVTFLAPVYYPVERLPPILRFASYFLYTANLGSIGRSIMMGTSVDIVSVGALVCFLLLCLLIVIRGLNWREL